MSPSFTLTLCIVRLPPHPSIEANAANIYHKHLRNTIFFIGLSLTFYFLRINQTNIYTFENVPCNVAASVFCHTFLILGPVFQLIAGVCIALHRNTLLRK